MCRAKLMLLLPEFSKRTSAAALRWNFLASALEEKGYQLLIVEIPSSIPYIVESISMRKWGKRSTLITIHGVTRIKSLKVLALAFTMRRSLFEALYKHIIRTLIPIARAYNPHLILASVPPPHLAIIAKVIASVLRIPYVIDVRDLIEDFYLGIELKRRSMIKRVAWIRTLYRNYIDSLRNAECLITVTTPLAEVLSHRYGVKTFVIPNGPTIKPSTNVLELSRRSKRIIYAGKISYGMARFYNLHKFILAWKKVSREFNDYTLELIGGGELLEYYQKLVVRYDVRNVRFSGVKHFELVYNDLLDSRGGIVWCNDFRNYSYLYAVPTKFYDYISAGTPVFVAGPHGSLLELLIKQYNLGMYKVVKKCCIEDIAYGLIEFLEHVEKSRFDSRHIARVANDFHRSRYVNVLYEAIEYSLTQR